MISLRSKNIKKFSKKAQKKVVEVIVIDQCTDCSVLIHLKEGDNGPTDCTRMI